MQLENIILIIICSLLFLGFTVLLCSVKMYLMNYNIIVATEATIVPIEAVEIKTDIIEKDLELKCNLVATIVL